MPDLGITIDGGRFSGWQSVSVHRSIETISGAFDVAMAEIEPDDPTLRAIYPGQACTVDLDGDTVITGWIDDVVPQWDATSHSVRVAGRDATGDLVDCSATLDKVEFANRRLEQIAAEICAPFGIPVRAEADTGAVFPSGSIDFNDKASSAIEELCRQRAILPVSDGRGALVLTRAGGRRAAGALAYGSNILSGRMTASNQGRFSDYIVSAQSQPQPGWLGTDAEERARDPAVTRYRPLKFTAEMAGTSVTARDRARWEASVRAGRGRRGEYTVQGWRDRDGKLWAPNTLVSIRDPFGGIDRELLITSVEQARSDRGSTTTLSVSPKEAFDLIELPAGGEDGAEGWTR